MINLHPVLQYHGFPEEMFDLTDVQDYSESVYIRQRIGPRTYHVPTDWVRFGLRRRDVDPAQSALSDQSVGYYSAVLDTLKRVVATRDFSFDHRVTGYTEKFIYLTPFIEHFLQVSAVDPVPLPVSEFYNFGGSRKFRIVLECRVPTSMIGKHGNQFIEFPERRYEEKSLWRVPVTDTTLTAVLVKEFPPRPE